MKKSVQINANQTMICNASHGLKIITNSVGRGLAPAAILYQIFVISPSVIFQKKNDSLALLRYPILLKRLGAPHKIDRYANRCSLYPPQAAVAYVARQRKAWFCGCFNLIEPVGTALAAVRSGIYNKFGQGQALSLRQFDIY